MALESTATTHDVSDVPAGSHLFHNIEERDSQRAPITAVDSTTTSSNSGGEAAVSKGGVLTYVIGGRYFISHAHLSGNSVRTELYQALPDRIKVLLEQYTYGMLG